MSPCLFWPELELFGSSSKALIAVALWATQTVPRVAEGSSTHILSTRVVHTRAASSQAFSLAYSSLPSLGRSQPLCLVCAPSEFPLLCSNTSIVFQPGDSPFSARADAFPLAMALNSSGPPSAGAA